MPSGPEMRNSKRNKRSNDMLVYAIGVSAYVCISIIILGHLSQTEERNQMLTVAGLLLVAGGLLFEMYKRRSGFKDIYTSIGKLQRRQSEILEEVVRRPTATHPEMNRYIKESFKVGETEEMHFEVDVKSSGRTIYKDDGEYSDEVILGFLKTALADEQLQMRAQPIVRLPQRQVVFYELYAYLRAGPTTSISAARYMPIAQEHGLESAIDFVFLKNCLRHLKQQKVDKPFVLNIKDESLVSKDYMNTLLAFVSHNRHLADKLIFEIRQDAFQGMQESARRILNSLQKLGCRFSMDHVDDPHLDRELIRELGISYIKLSADNLSLFTRDNNSVAVMRRIKNQLEKENVFIIAEKIEDEEVLKDILDLELDYGEGYIFGRPDKLSQYEPIKYAA